MKLISCKNITMAYENNIAVNDVTFQVEEGDYISIVGENGSGKSTLLKGLLNILKPKSGVIEFCNGIKASDIGYLPQQTVVQKDFPASVFEVVVSGCLNKKGLKPFYSKSDKKRAKHNMEKLGICEIEKKCYRDLSGGQQQRVLIARALCATEKILLLDEPVTGLDPIVTMDLYNMIKKLNEEEGITIIIVSHDIKSAIANSKKILHMDKSIKFLGNVKEYIENDASKGFLGGDFNA